MAPSSNKPTKTSSAEVRSYRTGQLVEGSKLQQVGTTKTLRQRQTPHTRDETDSANCHHSQTDNKPIGCTPPVLHTLPREQIGGVTGTTNCTNKYPIDSCKQVARREMEGSESGRGRGRGRLTDLDRSCVSHALRVRGSLLHGGKVQNHGFVSAGGDKLQPRWSESWPGSTREKQAGEGEWGGREGQQGGGETREAGVKRAGGGEACSYVLTSAFPFGVVNCLP